MDFVKSQVDFYMIHVEFLEVMGLNLESFVKWGCPEGILGCPERILGIWRQNLGLNWDFW